MPVDSCCASGRRRCRTETLADGGFRGSFTDVDSYGRPGANELYDLVRSEAFGEKVFFDMDSADQDRVAKREGLNNDIATVRDAFNRYEAETGVDPATLPREQQREIALGGLNALDQSAGEPDAGASLRARWMADFDSVWAEYAALTGEFDTKGGRVLNTDLARELSPEYRANRSLSADVHEAASDFIREAYRRKLAQPTPEGLLPVVIFSAGGTGAGKTTGLALYGELADKAEIIYDTNTNRMESAVGKLNAALRAKNPRQAVFIYTYRDPVEALRNGALPRAARMELEHGSGRTVPLTEHARTHVGAAQTIRSLFRRFGKKPSVKFYFYDNSLGKGNATKVDIDSLPMPEENNLYERLAEELEQARTAGEISEAVYRGFKKDDVPGIRGRVGEGSSSQPEPTDRQDALTQDPAAGGVSASGEGLSQGGKSPRGQIVGRDGQSIIGQKAENGSREFNITLFEGKDLSTVLHEAGHAFFEIFGDLAEDANASEQLKADYAALLAWAKVKDRSEVGRTPVFRHRLATWHCAKKSTPRPACADLGVVHRHRNQRQERT